VSEPPEQHSAGGPEPTPETAGEDEPERVGDALRMAVERTLSATAGSASGTRRRAQELLDEVARRGQAAAREASSRGEAAREEVRRRGGQAREEVVRRGESARDEIERRSEGAGARLAEALSSLRGEGEESPVLERLSRIERRLGSLERVIGADRAGERPGPASEGAQPNPRAEGEISAAETDAQAVSWDPREGGETSGPEPGGGDEERGEANPSGA
jgi:polyhydroxyalkanoate synthesis regulator phasin